MPVTYTKDKNGRWVGSGSINAQEAEPLVGPTGFDGGKPKPKRKPAQQAKPWYWHLTPEGMANNLKYEMKRAERFNKPLPGEKRSFATPVSRQIAAGILAKAPADAALSLLNLLQRSGESQTKNPYLGYLVGSTGGPFGPMLFGLFGTARDPETTASGRVIVRARRAATKALGARLPEQYSPQDRLYEDIPAGFAANIAVAPLTAGAGGLVRGTGVAANLAKAGVKPGLIKMSATAARWAVGLGANEAAANLVTDNTEGGASQLIKATGAPWPDALTANPKRDDRISAALRETPASMGFAAGIGALGGAIKGGLRQVPHVARALRENRAAQEMRTARAKTVDNGLQRENPDTGEHEFTPEAKTPPPPPAQAPPRPRTPGEYDAATLEEYRRRLQGEPATAAPEPAVAPQPKPIPTREGGDYTDFGKARPAPLPTGHSPALDPWKDDAAYQDWLRSNSSNALAPLRPAEPAAPADPLPRQPLAPRDELRGEGLADPWGMGPDPTSPVQRELGRKAGAIPQEPATAAPAVKEPSTPEEEFFDPEIPEIDHAALALDRLDPEVVSQIAQTPGPVLPQIEEALASRPPVTPRPELTATDVTAPTQKLAQSQFLSRREEWANLRDNELLGVFHPDVNPGLARLIESRTGRSFDELTRGDAIETLSFLADQGATVMPDRLKAGIELARTTDLVADPQRFQYKLNTDKRGVQKGSSLEGLDRWNTSMEGVLLVWEDPATGRLYVVNGHNRLAKALELGIPTVPVRRLLANTAEQARALGALDNIASGGGTPWDAAKFFRDARILDAEQAGAAGLPLSSGHAQRGLALAQLPDNIFQAGLAGEIPEGRALALGGSGLSPEKMQAVWSEYQGDKFFRTEENFQQLIDLARDAPTTAADSGGRLRQGEIPGLEEANRDLTKTLIKLSREVEANLRTDKRALVGASRNAGTLETRGNSQIDAQTAMQAGMDTEQLARVFTTMRFLGNNEVNALLKAGAEEVAAGASLKAVARRIQGELAQAAEKVVMPKAPEAQAAAMAPEVPAPEAPMPRTEQDALADQLLILNRAAAQGEVRPSATTIPDVPEAPSIADLFNQANAAAAAGDARVYRRVGAHIDKTRKGLMELDDVANSADALKLAQQQRQAALDAGDTAAAGAWDAEIRKINQGRLAAEEARRSATQAGLFGVEEFDSSMPLFDQAKLDAEEARLEAEYLDRDTAAQQAIARAEREASGYEEKTFDQKVAEHGIADGWQMPESAPPAAAAGGSTPATARRFTFPADLAKSKPRYGMATLTFSNDIDRASYILRDASKKSKGEDRLIQSLEAAGFDVAEIRQHGKKVHASVKQLIAQKTGSAAAPQKAMDVNVPSSSFPGKFNGSNNYMLASQAGRSTQSTGKSKLVEEAVRLLDSNALLEDKDKILASSLVNTRHGYPGVLGSVYTLGREGASLQLERDLLHFLDTIMGGGRSGGVVKVPVRLDIADYLYSRDILTSYGLDEVGVHRLNGVMTNNLYTDAASLLIIAREDLTSTHGIADFVQTGVHEAVHWLQFRRLTQAQLETLASDEAIAYFQKEAAKSMEGYAGLDNAELQAWGSQRYLAARLLDDMAALYKKEGQTEAAALLEKTRRYRLGEYDKVPTKVEQALKPMLELFERFKNYMLGVGFKLNSELTSRQLAELARFAIDVLDITKNTRLARYIYASPLDAPPPTAVKELLESIYSGSIGKQMLQRPGKMPDAALDNYLRRMDLLYDTPPDLAGRIFQSLSSTLRDVDGGKLKGVSQRALQLADEGDPNQALREASDYAERRVAELDAEIESIKQRAITEGC